MLFFNRKRHNKKKFDYNFKVKIKQFNSKKEFIFEKNLNYNIESNVFKRNIAWNRVVNIVKTLRKNDVVIKIENNKVKNLCKELKF